MSLLRRTASAVATAAAVAATLPLASAPAEAVEREAPVIRLDVDWYGIAFSPNGDHSKDRALVAFTLAKASRVTVTVHPRSQKEHALFSASLGTVGRGDHTWVWDGRNAAGKLVADGWYAAKFVVDQVAAGGETRSVRTDVWVDRTFDAQWRPRVSAGTVYPNTPDYPGYPGDVVWVTLKNSSFSPMTALGWVVQTIKDDQGRVISREKPLNYNRQRYPATLRFRGLDGDGKPLPAGTYQLRFLVHDLAGNRGRPKSVTVRVSDTPLVMAAGSVVVAPTAFAVPTSSSRRGDDPIVPCGVVVPSEVYAEPGAMSYRSADTCAGTYNNPNIATAPGGVDLSTLLPKAVAPRGLRTSWLTMRGRPTVAGETDTADIFFSTPLGSPVATSPATVDESMTSTPVMTHPYLPPSFKDYVRGASWSIQTNGTDSFDVATVTLNYTYLTPQS